MINVTPVTPSQALQTLESLWDLPVAVMLWGPPGVGKSTMVADLARRKNAGLCDVRLADKVASELGGLPAHDHDRKKVVYYHPEFWPDLRRDGEVGILFLDELPGADDQVRIASYGLLLERRIGSYRVPHGWRIFAAGNRPEDDPVASEFGTALNDRLIHLVVQPDTEDWLKWAVSKNIAREVMAFIKTFPQHLTGDNRSIQRGDAVVPSPRSWERVSDILKSVRNPQSRRIAIEGLIGKEVGANFFLVANEIASLATVEEILTAVNRVDLIPNTMGGLYALCYALAASVNVKNAGPILEVIDELTSLPGRRHDGLPMADIQTLAATICLERMLELGIDCSEHRSFLRLDARRRQEQLVPA